MKKNLPILLAAIMVLTLAVPAFAQGEGKLVLVSGGATDYRVVISENASPCERKAAEILCDYFSRISKVRLKIVTDSTESAGREIVIGVTSRDGEAKLDRSGYGDDGVRILTVGDKLFLTGGEQSGSIYSVYTFLEDYLGCRWFTHDLTVVPESDEISVPSNIDYTYVPCFKLRQTYWLFSTMYSDYCSAHKLHGVMAYVPDELGGCGVKYAVNSVHTLQWIVTQDLFETHPEYFGCDENGSRSVNRQPCLMNEDVLNLAVKWAENFFSQYSNVCSISQNDGQPFCQCEKCTAFKKAHGGSDSACMIDFVNRVAAKVKEKYPDARLETLAYQDSLTPPENLAIDKNIVIRMCPVNGCVLHDFDDPSCKKNKVFNEALKGWVKLTDNIYMWNYSTNFQDYYALFPNITTLQARYRYFRDNNVIAVFDNGCGDNMVPAEFHELRTYLILKLMWDPDTDVERHISEFCKAYYGNAADDVIEFIHQFEKDINGFNPMIAGKVHMTCQDGGENLDNGSALTEREIRGLNKIMERALTRQLTGEQAQHLQGLSLSWRFFKCATFAGEYNWFSFRNNPEEEANKLYHDMKDYGICFLAENGGLPFGEGEPNCTVRPTWWFAEESAIPSSVRTQAKLLPVVNKILRTVFWFAQ